MLRTITNILTIAALAIVLVGCSSNDGPERAAQNNGAQASPDETAQPELIDGVQVVQVQADMQGFTPARIELEAGVPTRLEFTRTDQASCIQRVTIPEMGVEETELPLNEPVAIEFTPAETGEFTFVCQMDMLKGSLLVRA